MASHCPHCKDRNLHPSRIETDLPALSCDGCGGSLLSLVAYRHWRENQPEQVQHAAESAVLDEVQDTSVALCCPKCRHFMTKFRVSADARNQIDLCVHCDEAWLDRGEWQLLDNLALAGRLTQCSRSPGRTACAPPRPSAAPNSSGANASAPTMRARRNCANGCAAMRRRARSSPTSIRCATRFRAERAEQAELIDASMHGSRRASRRLKRPRLVAAPKNPLRPAPAGP